MVTAEIFVSEPKSALQVSCIQLLELLDGRYPESYTLRIIDDDCRDFESPEIQLYIWGKRKGRFEVYRLPTDGEYTKRLVFIKDGVKEFDGPTKEAKKSGIMFHR